MDLDEIISKELSAPVLTNNYHFSNVTNPSIESTAIEELVDEASSNLELKPSLKHSESAKSQVGSIANSSRSHASSTARLHQDLSLSSYTNLMRSTSHAKLKQLMKNPSKAQLTASAYMEKIREIVNEKPNFPLEYESNTKKSGVNSSNNKSVKFDTADRFADREQKELNHLLEHGPTLVASSSAIVLPNHPPKKFPRSLKLLTSDSIVRAPPPINHAIIAKSAVESVSNNTNNNKPTGISFELQYKPVSIEKKDSVGPGFYLLDKEPNKNNHEIRRLGKLQIEMNKLKDTLKSDTTPPHLLNQISSYYTPRLISKSNDNNNSLTYRATLSNPRLSFLNFNKDSPGVGTYFKSNLVKDLVKSIHSISDSTISFGSTTERSISNQRLSKPLILPNLQLSAINLSTLITTSNTTISSLRDLNLEPSELIELTKKHKIELPKINLLAPVEKLEYINNKAINSEKHRKLVLKHAEELETNRTDRLKLIQDRNDKITARNMKKISIQRWLLLIVHAIYWENITNIKQQRDKQLQIINAVITIQYYYRRYKAKLIEQAKIQAAYKKLKPMIEKYVINFRIRRKKRATQLLIKFLSQHLLHKSALKNIVSQFRRRMKTVQIFLKYTILMKRAQLELAYKQWNKEEKNQGEKIRLQWLEYRKSYYLNEIQQEINIKQFIQQEHEKHKNQFQLRLNEISQSTSSSKAHENSPKPIIPHKPITAKKFNSLQATNAIYIHGPKGQANIVDLLLPKLRINNSLSTQTLIINSNDSNVKISSNTTNTANLLTESPSKDSIISSTNNNINTTSNILTERLQNQLALDNLVVISSFMKRRVLRELLRIRRITHYLAKINHESNMNRYIAKTSSASTNDIEQARLLLTGKSEKIETEQEKYLKKFPAPILKLLLTKEQLHKAIFTAYEQQAQWDEKQREKRKLIMGEGPKKYRSYKEAVAHNHIHKTYKPVRSHHNHTHHNESIEISESTMEIQQINKNRDTNNHNHQIQSHARVPSVNSVANDISAMLADNSLYGINVNDNNSAVKYTSTGRKIRDEVEQREFESESDAESDYFTGNEILQTSLIVANRALERQKKREMQRLQKQNGNNNNSHIHHNHHPSHDQAVMNHTNSGANKQVTFNSGTVNEQQIPLNYESSTDATHTREKKEYNNNVNGNINSYTTHTNTTKPTEIKPFKPVFRAKKSKQNA